MKQRPPVTWFDVLICALLLVLTFLLTQVLHGCAADPLLQTDRDAETFTVTWRTDIGGCPKYAGRDTEGCAVWSGDRCIIFARVPRDQHDEDAMAAVGHEMLHCRRGHFHPAP